VLRITWTGSELSAGEVKVEGEVAGDHVHELARFAESVHRPGLRILFDMSDVTFVDGAGAALLRRLRVQGFSFVDGSSFVSTLFDATVGLPGTGEGG
jgi:ABC-type transporter Mla MlaB component